MSDPFEPGLEDLAARVAITRIGAASYSGPSRSRDFDLVAREEPLEIRIAARSLGVVMRTPGHDEELATGLLVTERVVAKLHHLESVRHCSVAPDPDADGNVIDVRLAGGVEVDWEALRRNLFASASCGVCGKATVENALATASSLDDPTRVREDVLFALSERVAAAQLGFAATGGLHAAALFDANGELLVVREDVGRHNAVDKVIGWALRANRVPLAGHLLWVSGRVSFEIAQKALAARIPIVTAVSAPSSLAVQLAEGSELTLVAFLRAHSASVYGCSDRVQASRSADRINCRGPRA